MGNLLLKGGLPPLRNFYVHTSLFFSFPRLALRARVALRAKYRVRPAWLIKRLSCRLRAYTYVFMRK